MHKSRKVIHHDNIMKEQSYIIILIKAEKASDKIQHTFMIKALNKLCKEGMYLNIIKAIYPVSPQVTPHSMIRIRNKGVNSCHFYSAQYSKS